MTCFTMRLPTTAVAPRVPVSIIILRLHRPHRWRAMRPWGSSFWAISVHGTTKRTAFCRKHRPSSPTACWPMKGLLCRWGRANDRPWTDSSACFRNIVFKLAGAYPEWLSLCGLLLFAFLQTLWRPPYALYHSRHTLVRWSPYARTAAVIRSAAANTGTKD